MRVLAINSGFWVFWPINLPLQLDDDELGEAEVDALTGNGDKQG